MIGIRRIAPLAVFVAVFVMAVPAPVRADTTSRSTAAPAAQVLPVSAKASPCEGLPADEARQRAEQAERQGAHRRAAACFRVAGDHVHADRALIRAAADARATASRQASKSADVAKLQAERLKEAFR